MTESNPRKPLILFGRQPVLEALRASFPLQEIFLAREASGKIIAVIKKLALLKKVPINFVKNKNDVQKISGPVVHQGIAAVGDDIITRPESGLESFLTAIKSPFFVVLDQIQDPHNMGAIMRSCEIAGVDALIVPDKGSAELNGTVAKTSVGALFHLNIFRVSQLESSIELFKGYNINTLALMPSADDLLYNKNLKKGIALVVGSEGSGVRKNIVRLCNGPVSIPQFGKINSLNASVATAVVLYEVVRQRLNTNPK